MGESFNFATTPNPKNLEIHTSKAWESREPFIFGKDYFQLQFDFCKEIQKKTGEPLFDIIKYRTSILRFNAFDYDGYELKGINPNITEENMIVIKNLIRETQQELQNLEEQEQKNLEEQECKKSIWFSYFFR